MDALILPPLRSTMSKSVSVEDQGKYLDILSHNVIFSRKGRGLYWTLYDIIITNSYYIITIRINVT